MPTDFGALGWWLIGVLLVGGGALLKMVHVQAMSRLDKMEDTLIDLLNRLAGVEGSVKYLEWARRKDRGDVVKEPGE